MDEGTGLGLFVTQKIVKTLRGKLLFSRNESGGLTVRVCLPASPHAAAESAEASAPPEIMGCGERILVVESDPEVLAATCACLTKLGYEPIPADSPGRGVETIAAQSGRLDLVLTEDGTAGQVAELCAALASAGSQACVVLASASPTLGLALRPARVGRVISKPVDMGSLGRALRHCLSRPSRKM
jgi:CheY-like chemotaxis protein